LVLALSVVFTQASYCCSATGCTSAFASLATCKSACGTATCPTCNQVISPNCCNGNIKRQQDGNSPAVCYLNNQNGGLVLPGAFDYYIDLPTGNAFVIDDTETPDPPCPGGIVNNYYACNSNENAAKATNKF